jgi:hypothetical protein
MRERPILIAYRRFEQLQELFFARGYLVDPSGRDPNEWRDDPPLGLVRLKGVALKGEDEDAEPDPRITFSVTELWSVDPVEDAVEEQGYWLAGYSHHGQVGDVSLRYCFDPQRHPEMPYHRHPPRGKAREPWRRVSVEEALEAVDALSCGAQSRSSVHEA